MKYLSLLLTVLLLGLLGCSEAGPVGVELESESVEAQQDAVALAKKPLWGTTYTDFNLGVLADPTKPSWVGTLTIDDEVYGIVFYSLGSSVQGSAMHFEEKLELYTWVAFDFETQTLTTGDPLLWGYSEGVLNMKTLKFRSNGVVEEAFGDFSMWEGRHQHNIGTVVFHPDGYPLSSTGNFRLN